MLNFGDGTHIHATFEADGAVDLDDRQHLLDCYSGIAFASPVPVVTAPGKGRPTITIADRQAVLLWAELQVPEPSITATALIAPPAPLSAPAAPVPLVLSGARAVRPKAPTPILVLGAASVLDWAELQVPGPPLELTPDEMLAAMMLWEDT